MGLGPAASTGTIGLTAPTLDITHTGQEEVIKLFGDGDLRVLQTLIGLTDEPDSSFPIITP